MIFLLEEETKYIHAYFLNYFVPYFITTDLNFKNILRIVYVIFL